MYLKLKTRYQTFLHTWLTKIRLKLNQILSTRYYQFRHQIQATPLSLRITGWYSILLLIMLAFLSLFIVQVTHRWEYSIISTSLQNETMRISEHPEEFKPMHHGIFFVIYEDIGPTSNKHILVKGTLPPGFASNHKLSPNKISRISDTNDNETTYFYFDRPIISGVPAFGDNPRVAADHLPHYWVRAIIPVDAVAQKTHIILLAFLFGSLVFLIITTLGGYVLIKRGLRPIRNITRTASLISHNQDLSQRIRQPINSHDEIAQLTHTFNQMLSTLEAASQREKQFNSDVSHELRTPISVIQAESEFGKKYISSVDEAKESFDHIYRQSRFMTNMVSQLLDMARLDNMQHIEVTSLSLSDLLNEMVHEYRLICASQEKNIQLETDIAPNVTIQGNPTLLKRAIGNIIDNAIKFTSDHIAIKLKVEKGLPTLSITDNGIGIKASELGKIWDRLYQTESSRHKKSNKGIGIGLYFVKNVINRHKAHIAVSSISGQQTTFTIQFPTNNPYIK